MSAPRTPKRPLSLKMGRVANGSGGEMGRVVKMGSERWALRKLCVKAGLIASRSGEWRSRATT